MRTIRDNYYITTGHTYEEYCKKFRHKIGKGKFLQFNEDEIKYLKKNKRYWEVIGPDGKTLYCQINRFKVKYVLIPLLVAGLIGGGIYAGIRFIKPGSSPEPEPKPSYDYDWYKKEGYIDSLTEDDVTKKDTIQHLLINGVDHKVKLVGVDQDEDANGNKIHSTWEFQTVLSKNNKKPINICWDNITSIDYPNSLLGNACENDYPNLLPEDLKKMIKKPKKYYAKSTDNGHTWTNEIYYPQLFPLCLKEMNITNYTYQTINSEDQITYKYYSTHTDKKYRIKYEADGNATNHYTREAADYNDKGSQYGKSVFDIHSEGDPVHCATNGKVPEPIAPSFCI